MNTANTNTMNEPNPDEVLRRAYERLEARARFAALQESMRHVVYIITGLDPHTL
jgi:hypothetical protein